MGRNTLKMYRMVDPSPEGYLYGFPKRCPDDVTNLGEWAVANGYPRRHLAYAVFRTWQMEDKPPAEPYHVEGPACDFF